VNYENGQYKDVPLLPLAGTRLNIVSKPKREHFPLAQHPEGAIPKLYHGTPASITPGSPINIGGPMSKDYGFATSDPHLAASYAISRNKDLAQPAIWGVVHQVEAPEGKTFIDKTPHGASTRAYISKQFKVRNASHLVDTTQPENSSPDIIPLTGNNRGRVQDGWKSKKAEDWTTQPKAHQLELPGFEPPDVL